MEQIFSSKNSNDEIGIQSKTMDDTALPIAINGDGDGDPDVVDCRQTLSTAALVGLIAGGSVVGVALITLIFCAFCYIPSRKIQGALHGDSDGNVDVDDMDLQTSTISKDKVKDDPASSDAGTEHSGP